MRSVSSVDGAHWRKQRVIVRNVSRPEPLSAFDVGTGLVAPPAKPWPSPFAARATSFVFHPTEMLYALGQPNGSRTSRLVFAVYGGSVFVDSAHHRMRSLSKPRLGPRREGKRFGG
jgi:hypothetical protein